MHPSPILWEPRGIRTHTNTLTHRENQPSMTTAPHLHSGCSEEAKGESENEMLHWDRGVSISLFTNVNSFQQPSCLMAGLPRVLRWPLRRVYIPHRPLMPSEQGQNDSRICIHYSFNLPLTFPHLSSFWSIIIHYWWFFCCCWCIRGRHAAITRYERVT